MSRPALRMVDQGPRATADSVAAALRRVQFRFANEDQLQEGIFEALGQLLPDCDVRREVILDGGLGRVDLMVDRVAVEVKIAGTTAEVTSQVRRYATSREIDELVLVTNRVLHGAGEGLLEGKPAQVVSLIGSQL